MHMLQHKRLSNKAVLNLFILIEQALLWELLWKDLHLQFLHKKNYLQKGKHVSPKFLTKYMGNIAASHLSIQYGIKGPSLTVTTACSSGGDAITVASMLLKAGMADAIVVMAGESAINPVLIQSLAMSGALSRTGMSRPFDQKKRDGFYYR